MSDDSKKLRDEKGRFPKGVSGNPKGRPKAYDELQGIAREHTRFALATLLKVMRDKRAPANAKVFAANSVLDRGWGKPAQSIDLTNSDGSLSQLWQEAVKTADELDAEASVQH